MVKFNFGTENRLSCFFLGPYLLYCIYGNELIWDLWRTS